MAHLILSPSDYNPVSADASSEEPVALRVRLESEGPLRPVAQLWREGFVRVGGRVVAHGQRVHATFVLSRYLSLTLSAVAGDVIVETPGEEEQVFRFAPEEPEIIEVLMSTAIPDEVVH
jgi:hypothetical protein